MRRIGVLSLQGSVIEHMRSLQRLEDVIPVEVKTLDALNSADALILPGGESTTISKLLNIFGLMEPIRKRIEDGMPVWGTCAGMILLARDIVGESPHLNVMDISVMRNAYGRQADSFTTNVVIPQMGSEPIPLVFVRAPWVQSVGEGVEVLCELDGHIVAARQRNMLVTSFHPELTDDLSVHRYFVNFLDEK